MNTKLRLIILNFLQFAVWGAYLTSMGRYLGGIGLGTKIGLFYSMQGIVSLFMPAIIGIIADKWIQAQRLLGLCHFISAAAMISAGLYGHFAGGDAQFSVLFSLYAVAVGFYMPTLSLSNSVAFTILEKNGYDTIKDFPPIRIFGTIGFICSMWLVDLIKYNGVALQQSSLQFCASGVFGVILALYCLTLQSCPVSKSTEKKSFVDAFGLRAFTLFKRKEMAMFFIFSMLLGVALQITNGFANPFISSFGEMPQYSDTFGVKHANLLISLSQISETLCILLIPFFLRRFGIKKVMLIAMLAWVLRFGLFGFGNPGGGVWMFILSMIVYGVAFDFFNISGSLFVNQQTDPSIRSSAQGLFVLMTNGIGAALGTLGAQAIVNHFVYHHGADITAKMSGWGTCWHIFAGYALFIAIMFAILFKYNKKAE